MVDEAKDPDDVGTAPRNGPPEPEEEPEQEPDEEPDKGSQTDRRPDAFYVWKNEGGAHLSGD